MRLHIHTFACYPHHHHHHHHRNCISPLSNTKPAQRYLPIYVSIFPFERMCTRMQEYIYIYLCTSICMFTCVKECTVSKLFIILLTKHYLSHHQDGRHNNNTFYDTKAEDSLMFDPNSVEVQYLIIVTS